MRPMRSFSSTVKLTPSNKGRTPKDAVSCCASRRMAMRTRGRIAHVSPCGRSVVVKPARDAPPPRLRLGVSACLLGAKVRFDGQHKRDTFLVDELGPLVDWVSVCPEVEVGMGVPRESVRLVADRGGAPRMLGLKRGADWTARMRRFSAARVAALAREELCGFVLKSKSPSCGMERVKVYADTDARTPLPERSEGIFTAALAQEFPNLQIEAEGRLADARLRENFIERV